jgi:predicted aspartyl protease
MQLTLKDDLPFVTLNLVYRGATLVVPEVLVDTGSASTILSSNQVARVALIPEPADILHTVRGVGGSEAVFTRRVDRLQVDSHAVEHFEIEIGGMEYGFAINGILGMDYLMQVGAIINLSTLALEFVR